MIKKISLVFVTIFMLFLAVSCGEKSVQYKVDLMYEDGTSYKSVTVNDDQTLSLDVLSKEALKEAIQNYKGTILLVCHEADFYQEIASRIINLEDYAL